MAKGTIIVILVLAGTICWYLYQRQTASNQQVTAMTSQLADLSKQLNNVVAHQVTQ